MVLSGRDDETVRASLRSLEQHNIDVSEIAHRLVAVDIDWRNGSLRFQENYAPGMV